MSKSCLIIKEAAGFFNFGIKSFYEDELLLIKIKKENKFSAKGIFKALKKNKIINIAFEEGISEDFINFFEGKINIFKKEKILFLSIDEIIKKLSGIYGIKDGSLALGIIAGHKTDMALRLIKNLSLKLKALYFYSEIKRDYKFTEDFYKKTGIPVIIKGTPDFSECHIVLYLSYDEIPDFKFEGILIDIFDKTDKPAIRDIKGAFKNPYNISDAVYLRLTNKPFSINSFK